MTRFWGGLAIRGFFLMGRKATIEEGNNSHGGRVIKMKNIAPTVFGVAFKPWRITVEPTRALAIVARHNSRPGMRDFRCSFSGLAHPVGGRHFLER